MINDKADEVIEELFVSLLSIRINDRWWFYLGVCSFIEFQMS